MDVKSMLVGFLIALIAATGSYFLVPPSREADAGVAGLTRDELWNIIEACTVNFEGKVFLIAGGEKSNTFQAGKIVCDKKGYMAHHGTSLNSK